MPIESIHDGCSYINDNTVQLRSVLHVSLQPKYHKNKDNRFKSLCSFIECLISFSFFFNIFDSVIKSFVSGPNFIIKNLPSVLIQILNDSLCCSYKYN